MKVLIPPPGKLTVYFDVDDTLILESHPDLGETFLLNDGEGWFHYQAHASHVKELKRLRDEGNLIVVWTSHQLGGAWAKQVVEALDLDGDNVVVMAKPDVFFDDMAAEEVLHPSQRKFLK